MTTESKASLRAESHQERGLSSNGTRMHRLTGLCGVLGALLFFVGDMLFYGHLGSGDTFAAGMRSTVAVASRTRLFAGGLVGPPAACLCIAGFWHVRHNVKRSAGKLREILFFAFGALMVAGSAVHTLWTAKGLALKYCLDEGPACSALLGAIEDYWRLAYDIGAVPGYLGAVLLLVLVLAGRTRYPKWTVLANPAALGLLSGLLRRLPAPFGAILVGGSTNLTIAAFFLVSLLTTWSVATESNAGGGRRDDD
jgi:uncharacterized protein DUF6796